MDRKLRFYGAGLHPAIVALALLALLIVAVAAGCGDDEGGLAPEILSYDGFIGSYYEGLSIEEAARVESVPSMMRMDAFIDFPATRPSFGGEFDSGRYSVRWQGHIWVPEEGVRGLVVSGLGRAGMLIDNSVVFWPDNDGGLIDERHSLSLRTGWRRVEIWYENLDRNTHSLRLGWMSPNSDLIPIAGGFAMVSPEQVPDDPLNLRCEAEEVGFQNALIRVEADSVALINAKVGANDVTSDAATSLLRADLIRLESESTITVTLTGTRLDGTVENGTCSFETPPLPVWVEGHWRAEYFDSTELNDPAGVRYEPARLAYPADLPFASSRTEWFPGTGINTFSVRWSAWMKVDEEGTYHFTVGSDDGARVFVDGTEVVDSWRDGGYRSDDGEIDLRPGYHEVELEYYQTYGGSGFDWEIARVTGPDSVELIEPDTLFGEVPEPAEESARVSTRIQNDLNSDDESVSAWLEAGCVESLDLLLNRPARIEIDGELLLLTLDEASTAHGLCILPGNETAGRVRLTDLEGNTTNWQRVEFERPVPEESSGQ